jgi:hypothetical protein
MGQKTVTCATKRSTHGQKWSAMLHKKIEGSTHVSNGPSCFIRRMKETKAHTTNGRTCCSALHEK